ncbi:MAG: M48 family metalloprotease, partial [Planctomycetota bacterium]
ALGAAFEWLFETGSTGAFFRTNPLAEAGVGAAFLAAGILAVPLALRLLWATRPLESGEIKEALEALGRKTGFRFREIRIWETGGLSVLNAAVAGLLPSLRTVFFTRSLVETLKVPELLSVFAHEVGHVKGRHAWFGLQLAAGWAGFVLAVDGGLLTVRAEALGLSIQAGITAVFAAMFILLSRRLERAADLFAVDAVGSVNGVTETLQRVALLNGDTRSMRSLTHASVETRVDFLKKAAEDPLERKRFEGGTRLWAGAVSVLMLLGWVAAAPRFFP